MNTTNHNDDTIDLKELFLSLLENWKIIISCIVIFTLISIFYIFITPKTYSISSEIKLNNIIQPFILINGGTTTSILNTQQEIENLKSAAYFSSFYEKNKSKYASPEQQKIMKNMSKNLNISELGKGSNSIRIQFNSSHTEDAKKMLVDFVNFYEKTKKDRFLEDVAAAQKISTEQVSTIDAQLKNKKLNQKNSDITSNLEEQKFKFESYSKQLNFLRNKNEISILSNGYISKEPVAPKKMIILALGLFIGAFFGCLIALLKFHLFSGIKALNFLNDQPNRSNIFHLTQLNSSNDILFLRKYILNLNQTKQQKILSFHRSDANTNSVELCIELANSLSDLGLKILFIDFSTNKEESNLDFKNYFLGTLEKKPTLQSFEKFDFINMSIKDQIELANVIENKNFSSKINQLKTEFDLIVFSLDPLTSNSSSINLAQLSDSNYLVFKYGESKQSTIDKIMKESEIYHINFDAFIATDVYGLFK